MFEHLIDRALTERARQVVVLAQDEARRLGHKHVGTEHILLGLLREGEGIAARVLGSLDIELERVRAHVDWIVGSGEVAASGEVPFTPHAEQVLDLALLNAARNLGHRYIGTQHILLALGLWLVRESEGVAARILLPFGADSERIRDEVMGALSGPGDRHRSQGQRRPPGEGKKSSKLLDQFGRNLTKLASDGKLEPVAGRETEIGRIMQALSQKVNPVLIGKPGVGKSAVVEGLADRIASGEVPELLENKQIYTLDLPALIGGLSYSGEFEEPLPKVLKEISERGDIILFIDELHDLLGAGGHQGPIDAASIVNRALAHGEQAIGAATPDQYREYLERDSALVRRFQPVEIEEPPPQECVEMLKAVRGRFETHYRGLAITDDALEAAVQLADRYLPDRFLPYTAIELIDEAAARTYLRWCLAVGLEQKIETARREKNAAIEAKEFEKAADLRDKERWLINDRRAYYAGWLSSESGERPRLGKDGVADIVGVHADSG